MCNSRPIRSSSAGSAARGRRRRPICSSSAGSGARASAAEAGERGEGGARAKGRGGARAAGEEEQREAPGEEQRKRCAQGKGRRWRQLDLHPLCWRQDFLIARCNTVDEAKRRMPLPFCVVLLKSALGLLQLKTCFRISNKGRHPNLIPKTNISQNHRK